MSKSEREQSHPTIDSSYSVEQQSIQLLKSCLPFEWLWREQSPDVFVDFHVEVVDAGEPTGIQFALQIKGTERPKRRKNWVAYAMERKPLAYYRDNARLPVFVALVDTKERVAYWLFAQRYLREMAAGADLENQNSLTLRFDPADCFSDFGRFREALKAAESYVRDLHPSSPAAAISERERKLQALDPDVGVKVSFKEGHELIELSPKKPLTFTFTTTGTDGPKAYHAMLDHGHVFQSEVEIMPPLSRLIQELMTNRKLLLNFEPQRREGTVQITCGSVPSVLQVNGHWQGGRKSVCFAGRLARTPLSVELHVEDLAEKPRTSFKTPFDLARWEGQTLLSLAWFDRMQRFVTALAEGEEFTAEYFIEGVPAGGFIATANADKSVQYLRDTIEWLSKCREVANHHRLDPALPPFRTTTIVQEREVSALWALATGNEAVDRAPGYELSFTSSSERPLPADWNGTNRPVAGALRILNKETFDFLGHVVEVPAVEHVFSEMELVKIETAHGTRRLYFKGSEGNTWTRRKPTQVRTLQ